MEMGHHSYEIARERYSIEKHIEKLSAVYESVLR